MTIATLAASSFGFLGLLIGSFLNVVIYRLPVMLKNSWRDDSVAYLQEQGIAITGDNEQKAPFNLMTPRSTCRQCGHQISAFENIPVISYVVMRGKCRGCQASIGLRYPIVEIVTAAAFAYCGYVWGLTWTGALWAGFSAALIALILIDWDTTLLPDTITLPLMWTGLLAATLGLIATPLKNALIGAMVGYMSLWSITYLFKIITKKQGMGHGDFKLLAALGAWLGLEAILPIVLISSVIGAIVGIFLTLTKQLRDGGYMPYGPFLGGAGFLVLWWEPHRFQAMLNHLLLGSM